MDKKGERKQSYRRNLKYSFLIQFFNSNDYLCLALLCKLCKRVKDFKFEDLRFEGFLGI